MSHQNGCFKYDCVINGMYAQWENTLNYQFLIVLTKKNTLDTTETNYQQCAGVQKFSTQTGK